MSGGSCSSRTEPSRIGGLELGFVFCRPEPPEASLRPTQTIHLMIYCRFIMGPIGWVVVWGFGIHGYPSRGGHQADTKRETAMICYQFKLAYTHS